LPFLGYRQTQFCLYDLLGVYGQIRPPINPVTIVNAFFLTLNPSPRTGEGFPIPQPLLPEREKGLEKEGESVMHYLLLPSQYMPRVGVLDGSGSSTN
jgi:hypothetical protein